MSENSSIKSILYALSANTGIAIAKTTAAIITGSGSMLAEAIHSFADCGNQLLLILGLSRSKKKPTAKHPLGYGKAIYFWSFIVAIMLFSMGGVFSIYEGIHKLSSKEPLNNPMIAVVVLCIGILLEGLALFGALRSVKEERRSQSLYKWFRNSRNSEMIVIIGEDIAAVSGLFLALAGVGLTILTGNPVFDAIGSICIGSVLVFVAVAVGVEVKSLLIGESANLQTRKAIEKFIKNQKSIREVCNIITLQMGKDVLLAVKAEFNHHKSVNDLAKSINDIEKSLKNEFKEIKIIFIEPDIKK